MFSNFVRSPNRLPFKPESLPGDGQGFLVVFDADGTLWEGDVADDFTEYAIKCDLISPKLWNQYRQVYQEDHKKGCEFLLQLYKGHNEDFLISMAQQWWLDLSGRKWISVVLEGLYYFSEHNYRIAIVSGTPTFILKPLEEYLPISVVLGMDAELDARKNLTGNVTGISCFGSGKVEKISNHFGDMPLVFAAGNSLEDIPMMESSGNVILSVYPSGEFLKESIKRNYRILSRPSSFI